MLWHGVRCGGAGVEPAFGEFMRVGEVVLADTNDVVRRRCDWRQQFCVVQRMSRPGGSGNPAPTVQMRDRCHHVGRDTWGQPGDNLGQCPEERSIRIDNADGGTPVVEDTGQLHTA